MATYTLLEDNKVQIEDTETRIEVVDIMKLKEDYKSTKAKINKYIDRYNSLIDLAVAIESNTEMTFPNIPEKLNNI